jgi:hypothetical protein
MKTDLKHRAKLRSRKLGSARTLAMAQPGQRVALERTEREDAATVGQVGSHPGAQRFRRQRRKASGITPASSTHGASATRA